MAGFIGQMVFSMGVNTVCPFLGTGLVMLYNSAKLIIIKMKEEELAKKLFEKCKTTNRSNINELDNIIKLYYDDENRIKFIKEGLLNYSKIFNNWSKHDKKTIEIYKKYIQNSEVNMLEYIIDILEKARYDKIIKRYVELASPSTPAVTHGFESLMLEIAGKFVFC